MTPRQRVLKALTRDVPDRVPWGLDGFNRQALKIFREKTGTENYLEYFQLDYRFPLPKHTETPTSDPREVFEHYHRGLPASANIDEWGIGYVPGSDPAFDILVSPLKEAGAVDQIKEYPLPNLCHESRYVGLKQSVEEIHRDNLASVGGIQQTVFEIAWGIRGFAELMMDFSINEKIASCLLDRITELRCFQATKYAEAGMDIIMLGDDVGMQDRLILSPEIWRQWLKPRLKEVIRSILNVKPDTIIFYHSDGYIEPLIEELIEIGISVLNPVQPECLDPAKLKEKYGDRMAFWGTVGIQTTLPFGTPDEVKRVVKERIRTVGPGGGLLIAPTHAIEPDVPWENLMAFVEACEEYGHY